MCLLIMKKFTSYEFPSSFNHGTICRGYTRRKIANPKPGPGSLDCRRCLNELRASMFQSHMQHADLIDGDWRGAIL